MRQRSQELAVERQRLGQVEHVGLEQVDLSPDDLRYPVVRDHLDLRVLHEPLGLSVRVVRYDELGVVAELSHVRSDHVDGGEAVFDQRIDLPRERCRRELGSLGVEIFLIVIVEEVNLEEAQRSRVATRLQSRLGRLRNRAPHWTMNSAFL